MPWERAGVTLQGPGLSNCASLLNRLLCFSIHFIHCYSSASAFLPSLHCWNSAASNTATFYSCAGRSRARCSGITALQSRATAPHCCNSYCTSAQNKALCSSPTMFDQWKWPISTPLWPLHCPSFSSTRTSSITVVNIKHLVKLWLFQWPLMLILLTFARRSNLGKFSKLFGQR